MFSSSFAEGCRGRDENYADCLRSAAFESEKVELHDEALTATVQQIGMTLLSAEVLVGLRKLGREWTSHPRNRWPRVRSPQTRKASLATLF